MAEPDTVSSSVPALFTHIWGQGNGEESEAHLWPVRGRDILARLPKSSRPCVVYFEGAPVLCPCGTVRIGPLLGPEPKPNLTSGVGLLHQSVLRSGATEVGDLPSGRAFSTDATAGALDRLVTRAREDAQLRLPTGTKYEIRQSLGTGPEPGHPRVAVAWIAWPWTEPLRQPGAYDPSSGTMVWERGTTEKG